MLIEKKDQLKTLSDVEQAVKKRVEEDSFLAPYEDTMIFRSKKALERGQQLTGVSSDVTKINDPAVFSGLADFASGHEYFGLHFRDGMWVFREWAPNALEIYIKGDFSRWKVQNEFALSKISANGVWEVELDAHLLSHKDHYRLEIRWPGGSGERIPAWTRRVEYASGTRSFNAQVWRPATPYIWKHGSPGYPAEPLLTYECHIGMAQENNGIGTFTEFRENILPRIHDAGYNAIQIMALAEHPYYASFGYQVSSFFACSSRFGTPEDLKALVDEAHGMGLRVLMDLVHSHAVKNEVEGLARFDGAPWQYFHEGARGEHTAWDSRCFDYSKPEVLHFLLSNCRFWMDEYRFDGFRFDGVTSMLFIHHGLGKNFCGYSEYFSDEVDEDALAYLTLANQLIHSLSESAITIAEDVSGMPGLAVPVDRGGVGFDYRYAMGVPDHWIKLTKDTPDELWSMGSLWHELTNRREDEKSLSYAESHDQAMVGDQTLMYRMVGHGMYSGMSVLGDDLRVARGMALHKMIRLATLATAGDGYLNFMGNEFGHPEWIDFPRGDNGWSYNHARRQWHLVDDSMLRYGQLGAFDRDMIALARSRNMPAQAQGTPYLLHVDEGGKVLAFMRQRMIFIFNFHAQHSHTSYGIPAAPGDYRVILDTDLGKYGGFDRQDSGVLHHSVTDEIHRHFLYLYLPARSAVVLERGAGDST